MMRILSVSDEIVPFLQTTGIRQRLGKLDAIVGCGDLPPSYLEYLVSVLDVPCFYINGNHDQPEMRANGTITEHPCGCERLDLRVMRLKNMLFAGVSGVLKYRNGLHQYTESEWYYRLTLLMARVMLAQQRYRRRIDVLLTHTPPAGLHDAMGAHRGPVALRNFVDRVKPRFVIHGHVHVNYGYGDQRPLQHNSTLIINTHGYRILDLNPVEALQMA